MTVALSLSREHLEATSILTLGAAGTLDGQPFTLVGRRCFSGRRGNLWNEWSLDGVPHFIAEFAGMFTLYREGSLLDPSEKPPLGERIPWLIVEHGTATRLAEWGEVDDGPEVYDFIDLSEVGAAPRRASVAEGRTFVGRTIDPSDLGLTIARTPPRLVPVANVSPPTGLELWLDVGDRGTLDGVEYEVLGIVARRSEDDHWEEYCVYSAGVGLRWLVVADGHWSYVSPVEPGAASAELDGAKCPKVTWAAGELPWAVRIGEVVMQQESADLTFENSLDEISWSRATRLSTDAIAQAFGKRALPRPR